MIENIFNPPICTIIAGPNGAGKTTFALNYLPKVAETRNFINADLIAAGLSPLSPGREFMAASRLFLRELNHYAAKVDSTQCLLNAGAEPERVFDQEGERQIIYSHDIYQRLQEMAIP